MIFSIKGNPISKLYSDSFLRQIRNDINIKRLIKKLEIPHKYSGGFLRSLCPVCNEINTATKKETNLARCYMFIENLFNLKLLNHLL